MKSEISIIILLLIVISISSCSSPELSPQDEAYFKFGDGVSEDTFIIKLTDPIKIDEASSSEWNSKEQFSQAEMPT